MSTYTKTDYVVPFSGTDPSVNLQKIVHSLADNVPQLSIQDEMKANEDGSLPTSDGTYYWGNLKYSGYSNFVLGFRIHSDVDVKGVACYRLIIRIYKLDIASQDTYNGWYNFANVTDNFMTNKDQNNYDIMFLNQTSNSFKYEVMTFDDIIRICFTGIKSGTGEKKQDFGVVLMSPLVDYFTSERLAAVLYLPAADEWGLGFLSKTWLGIHNGNETLAYTDNSVVIGGTKYYAGTNSVASPIVFKGGNYSTIPFYGFVNNSEFLYQIRVGSDSNYLTYAPGSKVELGGCTFVSVGMGLGLFARIS